MNYLTNITTHNPSIPFQKISFKDLIRFHKSTILVMHYNIDNISYATTCDFKNSGNFYAPHSLCKLLEKFDPYVAELWNMRSKSIFLLIENTDCKYILIVPPNIMVRLSNSDTTYNTITLYIYSPLPTICNTYYIPCLSSNTWINYNNMSTSINQVNKRASSFPTRLNTISEDNNTPGAEMHQRPESVHDGNMFANAIKTNLPRCPNERRHFRMMDVSHY